MIVGSLSPRRQRPVVWWHSRLRRGAHWASLQTAIGAPWYNEFFFFGISALEECTPEQKRNPTKTDCFALVSVSPLAPQTATTNYGDIDIPKGYQLAGKFTLFGWSAKIVAVLAVSLH